MSVLIAPPSRLTCIEVRGTLPGGTSRPLLAIAEDGNGDVHSIVLKLRSPDVERGHPHYGGTSLTCELVCAAIARAVGLDVPDYHIVVLAAGLADAVPDSGMRDLLRRNDGEHFGARFLEGVAEAPPGPAASLAARDRLEDVLCFDATTINGDRKATKPNLLRQGDRLFMIDHALAAPAHLWDDETIAASPLLPEDQLRAHCSFPVLSGNGRPYSRLPSRWIDVLGDEQWDSLRRMVPACWERRPGDVDRIFQFLRGRGARAGAISTDLVRVMR